MCVNACEREREGDKDSERVKLSAIGVFRCVFVLKHRIRNLQRDMRTMFRSSSSSKLMNIKKKL